MKHLLWIIGFLLFVLLGDRLGAYAADQVVQNSRFRYSRLYGGRTEADLLLVGNSRGLCLYEPYIQSRSGLLPFNISYNGLPADAAAALMADYLDRYPNTRLIVMDITLADRENDALLAGFQCYSRYSPRLNELLRHKTPENWIGGQVSRLFRYNHEIFQRAVYYRNRPDTDWLLDRVIKPELQAIAQTESYALTVQPYLVAQLAKAVKDARARGLTVRLVVAPYYPGFQVKNLNSFKQAVEAACGLPVHDYRNALTQPELFGDFMHPNKAGAEQFIERMLADGIFSVPK